MGGGLLLVPIGFVLPAGAARKLHGFVLLHANCMKPSVLDWLRCTGAMACFSIGKGAMPCRRARRHEAKPLGLPSSSSCRLPTLMGGGKVFLPPYNSIFWPLLLRGTVGGGGKECAAYGCISVFASQGLVHSTPSSTATLPPPARPLCSLVPPGVQPVSTSRGHGAAVHAADGSQGSTGDAAAGAAGA
jgi:hypothetical protein